MRYSTTFVSTLAAIGFVAAAGSASACEWYKQQVTAKAAPPAAEEQEDVAASPIDPLVLAKIESGEEAKTVEQK
jgi:hypothetical protein